MIVVGNRESSCSLAETRLCRIPDEVNSLSNSLRRISSSLLLATWQWTHPTESIATKSVDHVELTPWRNWIAHWTSNPEVAGSNPVGVGSREISKIDILALCGSVSQFDRDCVCGFGRSTRACSRSLWWLLTKRI